MRQKHLIISVRIRSSRATIAIAHVEPGVVAVVAASDERAVGEGHPLDLAFDLGVGTSDDFGINPLRPRRFDIAYPLVGLIGEGCSCCECQRTCASEA